MSDVTVLLKRIEQGDSQAQEELLPLVYEELRRLATSRMRREYAAQTLQPTALVHEAWLRLGGDAQPRWDNRGHFFGAAAEAMRRIMIERARRRHAIKHGGDQIRVAYEVAEQVADLSRNDDELLAVHEALDRFAKEDPRKAELVKLRYFAGLELKEAAEVLGVPFGTAKRWWTYSRAWLFRDLNPELNRAGAKGAKPPPGV